MAVPSIQTYHCICSSLLLSTTHKLSSLPRRALPSLDNAIIVPLPSAPSLSRSPSPETTASDEPSSIAQKPKAMPVEGYTLLLSTVADRNPTIIRRSDGFEKRFLLRCGRCRLVVGYELDGSHWPIVDTAMEGTTDEREKDAQTGKKTKVAYLLPGGIMSTAAMVAGQKITDDDVGIEGKSAIAAWE